VIKSVIAISRRPPQTKFNDPENRLTFLSIDFLDESLDGIIKKLEGAGGREISLAYHYNCD
jgi:hypothetical protein